MALNLQRIFKDNFRFIGSSITKNKILLKGQFLTNIEVEEGV